MLSLWRSLALWLMRLRWRLGGAREAVCVECGCKQLLPAWWQCVSCQIPGCPGLARPLSWREWHLVYGDEREDARFLASETFERHS